MSEPLFPGWTRCPFCGMNHNPKIHLHNEKECRQTMLSNMGPDIDEEVLRRMRDTAGPHAELEQQPPPTCQARASTFIWRDPEDVRADFRCSLGHGHKGHHVCYITLVGKRMPGIICWDTTGPDDDSTAVGGAVTGS